MKRIMYVLAAALLALPAPAQAEDAPAPTVHQALIDAKAGSIVSVKMVISLSGSVRGQTIDQEVNNTATGIIVDASGLVMLSAEDFSPRLPPQVRRMLTNLKVVPTNIRVIFPGDETEYDAILGAKDTKLGLGFVLIKDLKGREATPVNLSDQIKPVIGQTLYGVTRLGQGFDHAPMCDTATVVGALTKPRKVWLLSRASNFRALPLFDANGAVAGVVVNQEGVTDDAGTRICLLPLGVAQSTIKRSLKAAQDALEEALEAEAEAAEEAEAEKDLDTEAGEPKKDDDAKKGDDASKGDAKKDDGAKKDEPKGEPKKDEPKKDDPKKGDGE